VHRQCAVENRHLLVDEILLDVQQILVVLSPDVDRSFLDEAHLSDVEVGVELHHQLKMDYFLDEVGVELHHQLKMDYFLDEVQT
jgi:hypothetical protein